MRNMIGRKRGGEHEVDKISSMLRPDEKVIRVVTQQAFVKPSTYFITNQRLLIRDPSFLSDDVQALVWNEIGDIEISKGKLGGGTTIRFHRGSGGLEQSSKSSFWSTLSGKGGGGNVFAMEHIKNSEADDIYKILEEFIVKANKEKQAQQQPQTQTQTPPTNPLDMLKMKMINGEITEDEYERKRKLLE